MAYVELKASDIHDFKKECEKENEKLFITCLNGSVELDAVQSFDISGEVISLEYFDIKPLSFFIDDDVLEEERTNPEYLKESIGDYASEIGYNDTPDKFLVDRDCSKKLYLSNLLHKVRYEIIGDQVLIFKVFNVELRGENYNSILKDVDMTKFLKRNYKEPTDYKPSEDLEGIATKPVIVSTLLDGKTPYFNNEVDENLFRAWVICQFMKQLFKCTYDPFFEKDGLIHQRGKGYGEKTPEYDLPENLNYHDLLMSLSLSRQYISNENLLRRF